MYQWSSSNNNITLPFMMVEILMYMEKRWLTLYTPRIIFEAAMYIIHILAI